MGIICLKKQSNIRQQKNREYYRWDHKHKDIEIYDNKAHYIGSKDPVTGKMYRKGDMQVNQQLKGITK